MRYSPACSSSSEDHRPHARPHVAAARPARQPGAAGAAGHPCRRHQRQGLDGRLLPRHHRGGRALAPMSTPRRISSASTSASGSAGQGGTLIAELDLIELLAECEAANAGEPITFFEITTAAAFLAFARNPADYLLLEVGLGGRLDATNVIARPRATVITTIDYDHQQFLGTTLAAIAAEKAGILKRGRAVHRGAAARAGPRRRSLPRPAGGRCRLMISIAGLAGLRAARPARLPGRDRSARPAPAAAAGPLSRSTMPAPPSPPSACLTTPASPTAPSPTACATPNGRPACSGSGRG